MECFRKYTRKENGPYTYKRNLFATKNETRALRIDASPEENWKILSRFTHMPWTRRWIIPTWTLILVLGIMFHISALALASNIRKASTSSKKSERYWRSFAILVFVGMIVAPSIFLGIAVSHAVDDLAAPPNDEPRSTPLGIAYEPPPVGGGLGSVALSLPVRPSLTRPASLIRFIGDVIDNRWIVAGMFLALVVFFIVIGTSIRFPEAGSAQDSRINVTDQARWGLLLLYLVLFFATLLIPFCLAAVARWITRHTILNKDLPEDSLPPIDGSMPQLTPYTTPIGKDMVGTAIAPLAVGLANTDYRWLNWMLGVQRLGAFFTYPVRNKTYDEIVRATPAAPSPLGLPAFPGFCYEPPLVCPDLTPDDLWARGKILGVELLVFVIPLLFVICLLWPLLLEMRHLTDQDPTNHPLRASRRAAWGIGSVCWVFSLLLVLYWIYRIIRLYRGLP